MNNKIRLQFFAGVDGHLDRGPDWMLMIGGTKFCHAGYTVTPRETATVAYSACGAAQTANGLDDGCDIDVMFLTTDDESKAAWNALRKSTKENLVDGTEQNVKYGIVNRFKGCRVLPLESGYNEGTSVHRGRIVVQHYSSEG